MIRTILTIVTSMLFTLIGIGVFLRTVFKTLEISDPEDGF
jgi:hypothetical protein